MAYRITLAPIADSRYPLLTAYLNQDTSVAGLYDYLPWDPGAYRARAAELAAWDGDRPALSRTLLEENSALGAPAETLDAVRSLAGGRAVVVIGGQQPGVVTGPLYTFWKAAAVIQLARRLEESLGGEARVVPVFWIGAEDHDLQEIAPVTVLDPAGKLTRVVYDPGPDPSGRPYPARTSVGFLPAGQAAESFLDALAPNLWNTEFTPLVLDVLRRTAAESATLGDWFGRLMLYLFGREGLVLCNPLWPGIRALEGPIFARMLQRNREVAEAFALGRERVSALGFTPQVEKDPASANLYLYEGLARVPLYREAPGGGPGAPGLGPAARPAGGFRVGDPTSGPVMSVAELEGLAAAAPERLSTNVVLRPVAQDAILPVLAYVGGPGETSYYALYRQVFACLGRKMPVIYPRPSVTIVEPGVARNLAKTGLDLALAMDKDAVSDAKSSYLSETDAVGIDGLFDRLVADTRRSYDDLAGRLVSLDSSLGDLAAKNRERVVAEMEWLRNKSWQEHRRKCRDAVRRFENLEASLRPHGDYQERVYNIFPYLAKYGPGLARDLARLDLIPPGGAVDGRHRFVWM